MAFSPLTQYRTIYILHQSNFFYITKVITIKSDSRIYTPDMVEMPVIPLPPELESANGTVLTVRDLLQLQNETFQGLFDVQVWVFPVN